MHCLFDGVDDIRAQRLGRECQCSLNALAGVSWICTENLFCSLTRCQFLQDKRYGNTGP